MDSIARYSGFRPSERGSIFFAIFGAVVLVGILTAGIMSFMKGPLATSIRLTRANTAETQMTIGAQVAVMATASQANNGDCDADGYVEPLEWRVATVEPHPVGGGLVPMTLGISKKDPWGTEYGYCVWNHGPTLSGSGCGANILTGTNSKTYPVVALVSAGPDKAFSTTCRTFSTADANTDGDLLDVGDLPLVSKAVETDDDIILTYTYEEATGASGGLWSLKSSDPSKATINKDIETSGDASFVGLTTNSITARSGNMIDMTDGLKLPDATAFNIACSPALNGTLRRNASGTGLELCDGSSNTWIAATGGGVGPISTTPYLEMTPTETLSINVNGTCGSATCYSSNAAFTVTNQGQATSVALSASLSNPTNFEFVSNGCAGATLAYGASCIITIRAKTTGNTSYTGTLNVTGNNNPFANLGGSSINFPCVVGGVAPGGYYIGCNVGGAYNLITDPLILSSQNWGTDVVGYSEDSDGAQATANYMSYTGTNYPAARYCGDLIYGGKTDWYLPAKNEMINYVRTNLPSLPGYTVPSPNYYWTSSEDPYVPSNAAYMVDIPGGGGYAGYAAPYNIWYAICLRREGQAFPSAQADSTPFTMNFPDVTGVNAVRFFSSVGAINSINQSVAATISGGGSPAFKVNGGPEVTSATVSNGDTIQLVATAATGTIQTINFTAGGVVSTWRLIVPGLPGYLALTSGSWNGNLGGIAGANAKCLSDLTANNWLGKADATTRNLLDSTHVKALICSSSACNLPQANTQYNFAVSGDAATGGASLTTNASSYGPINNANWSGTVYFGGSKEYWVNMSSASSTTWGLTQQGAHCTSWTSASSGVTGYIGTSGSTTNGRWYFLPALTCDQTRRLLCMVHP